jgi:hypothetical protein
LLKVLQFIVSVTPMVHDYDRPQRFMASKFSANLFLPVVVEVVVVVELHLLKTLQVQP